MRPNTRFTWSGGYAIAYPVVGDGIRDLVYLPGWASNVDVSWDVPPIARFFEGLSSFSRLILLDRRGVGCSDRYTPDASPPLEEMADDVLAVMDAVGSRSATIFGVADAAFIAMLLAASAPKRVSSLVLFGAAAAWVRNDEMPWQTSAGEWEEIIAESTDVESAFENADDYVRRNLPSLAREVGIVERIASLILANQPPGAWTAELERWSVMDLRDVLPTIQTPTLVVHRAGDPSEPVESGRHLAEKIPGARFLELEGDDIHPWAGGVDAVLAEVEAFVTGTTRRAPETQAPEERLLATVLFTDIVGSTQLAAEIGDRAWRELLGRHHEVVRELLERFRGVEVDTAGDGFLARFDGPARGVHCAQGILDAVRPLGIEVRAGLHTGEVELVGTKGRRDRGPYRRTRVGTRGSERGPRVLDGEGPRRRLRFGVRRRRRARTEGCPRPLASVPGGVGLGARWFRRHHRLGEGAVALGVERPPHEAPPLGAHHERDAVTCPCESAIRRAYPAGRIPLRPER